MKRSILPMAFLVVLMGCQVSPPPAKAPPAANSPTAAARAFVQALVSGDVNGALARMSVAAQTTYSSKLPALASALAPCRQSVIEATSASQPGAVQVRFTPPCGDQRTASVAMMEQRVWPALAPYPWC